MVARSRRGKKRQAARRGHPAKPGLGIAGTGTFERARRQFLPAALEIQETPPSPVGRALMWLLLALFAIGILWSCLGQVDIVVTAPGRIVPSGQVKQLQAPALATVAALLVAEGESVAAGQPLLSLDRTYADADLDRLREQLIALAVEVAWRGAMDRWLADGRDMAALGDLPPRFAAALQSRANSLYLQHRAELAARLEGFGRELAANRAEQASLRAERERTAATLAVLVERVAAYRSLLDRQYGAKVQYLELLQQQTQLEHSLPVLAAREQTLVESAAAIVAGRDAALSEARKANLLALASLDNQRAALRQDIRKARQHRQQLQLAAPVSGTVQELAVHTVGGVVSPAQVLLKIVPDNPGIEVEALLQNRDIGFVSQGQSSQVKVDTFNFTKYGVIDAKVLTVSNDAVEDPQLGRVFKLRLLLEREHIQVGAKRVRLGPGMAVTAEIKTGRRRLIEFFLSPLLRYTQESLRER